jgi:hypothetical protein
MALFLFPALLGAVPASLADLSFLAGRWHGTSGSTVIEEHWMGPEGGTLLGMSREIEGGKTGTIELCVIEMREGSPVLFIRHFDSGSIAREERDKPLLFTLESLAGQKAVFYNSDHKARLTYARTSPKALTATLEKEKNGKTAVFTFNYTLMEH